MIEKTLNDIYKSRRKVALRMDGNLSKEEAYSRLNNLLGCRLPPFKVVVYCPQYECVAEVPTLYRIAL